MTSILQSSGLLVLLGTIALYSAPLAAATIAVACPGQSLQAAVDVAQPGDIIQVSGGCEENVLVRNEKQRLTIQGMGFLPTVNGPDATLPTINVRGKGILIQGLLIIGGRSGIHVNRGSNAVINGSAISSTEFGIRVDQQSFAVITNCTIANQNIGILVDESSTARVGYNLDTETSPSPNTITSNVNGIIVQGGSDAKIAGNTISGSTQNGVVVIHHSHAHISGNNIGNNGFDGIVVQLNSGAGLAFPLSGGPSFLGSLNNSNAGNNGVRGVSCMLGGYVFGSIGSLNGTLSAKNVLSPCQDVL